MSQRRAASREPARPRFRTLVVLVLVVVAGLSWWRSAADQGRAATMALWPRDDRPVDPRDAAAAVERFARLGFPVRCGGGNAPVVALTFDDGPGPYTEETLRLLRRSGARATFFLNGIKLEDRWLHLPRKLRRIGAIGNHAWSHAWLPGLSGADLTEEIHGTKEALEEVSGAPVRLFRPPFGALDPAVEERVRALGMLTLLWTVDSGDSAPGVTAGKQLKSLRRDVKPGAIVLLHENRGTTRETLRRFLEILARRGLRPVSVPELLALDPPSEQQLRTGSCPQAPNP